MSGESGNEPLPNSTRDAAARPGAVRSRAKAASVPGFVAAQIAGLAVGVALLLALYPGVGRAAGDVVTDSAPTPTDTRRVR